MTTPGQSGIRVKGRGWAAGNREGALRFGEGAVCTGRGKRLQGSKHQPSREAPRTKHQRRAPGLRCGRGKEWELYESYDNSTFFFRRQNTSLSETDGTVSSPAEYHSATQSRHGGTSLRYETVRRGVRLC